ncbi:MFS transporter [Cucumibacter marinus]|uniref:MFS transporter n=1 Tax=Cucumibacter marinus TaxID=1121252 RepID=UPI00041BBB14|nr:MFS transporter [Cucumibacter marinus]
MSSAPGSPSLKTFLFAYFGYVFMFDAMLAYAIYTALFQFRGISVAEIGLLIAFWSATAIILELPSGALSDRFDRRWLMVAAPLIKIFTFIVWGLAGSNIWLYGLGFLIWSAAESLMSGTKQALLYEHLDAAGRAQDYEKMLGRDNAAQMVGIGIGSVIGGFVATYSMDATLWLSIPPLIIGAVLGLFLIDLRRSPGQSEHSADAEPEGSYLDHMRNALADFRANRALPFLTVYIAGGLIVFEVLDEFDQLYYLAVDLPIWMFGIVIAVEVAAFTGISIIAHRLKHFTAMGWLLPLLAGVLLLLAAIGAGPVFVIFLLLAHTVRAPAMILSEARFQHEMDGASRATTTSALVVAQNVAGIAVTLTIGFLADAIGILPAYGWAGIWMLPVALWAFWGQRKGLSVMGGGPETKQTVDPLPAKGKPIRHPDI